MTKIGTHNNLDNYFVHSWMLFTFYELHDFSWALCGNYYWSEHIGHFLRNQEFVYKFSIFL